MTGNLSRTVLRGAGARESACLPDLTRVIYIIVILKKQKKPISFQLKEIGFFALLLKDFRRCLTAS